MKFYLSTWKFSLLGLALLAILACTGCGGDDSANGADGDTTVTVSSLSKAAFIRQADKTCVKNREQFDHVLEESFKSAGSFELDVRGQRDLVTGVIAPNYEELIEQLAALGAPSGDEAELEGLLDAIQGGIENAEAKPAKVFGTSTPFSRAVKLASAYGLSECALTMS